MVVNVNLTAIYFGKMLTRKGIKRTTTQRKYNYPWSDSHRPCWCCGVVDVGFTFSIVFQADYENRLLTVEKSADYVSIFKHLSFFHQMCTYNAPMQQPTTKYAQFNFQNYCFIIDGMQAFYHLRKMIFMCDLCVNIAFSSRILLSIT